MLDTRVRFYARTPTALFQKMTPPTAQRPPSTLSVNTYARRCVRGRACAQASCARDAHRVHRFDPFSSSIVQFVLPFQRLLFSLFSFQIRSFFTNFFSRSSGAGFFNLPFFRYSVRATNTRFSFSSKKRRYR